MSDPPSSVRVVTDGPVFDSSLPEARSAAAGLPVGAALSSGAAPCVEAQLVAALEDGFVACLQDLEPGLELQQLLLAFSPRWLGATAQLEWLRAHARCTAWWAAQQATALVAYAGVEPQRQSFEVRGEQVTLEDVAREEVGVVLRWTSNFTQDRIDEARLLVRALPQTLEALQRGDVSPAHVRVIAESASKLALTTSVGSEQFVSACSQLERRVLPVATQQGLSRTRSAANRAVSQIDPSGRMQRRDAAYQTRGVWLRDDPDGISTIIGRLASEHAHAAMNAIESLARADDWGDPSLGVGERRSLAMLHLVLNGTSAAGVQSDDEAALPEPKKLPAPIRAHVDVVVDLPTLLGLQDNDGEIVGGGSIAAESVRQLVLADPTSTMRRLVTDPTTGHLLDIGRRRYVIPDPLREFIEIRDQRCRFPGCHARASSAEIDHARPWDDGGPSDRSNLGALCKRHHQVKTHGGWTITSSKDSGACIWRSPSGSTYAHDVVSVLTALADTSAAEAAAPTRSPKAEPAAQSAESGVPFPHGGVGQARHLIDDDT